MSIAPKSDLFKHPTMCYNVSMKRMLLILITVCLFCAIGTVAGDDGDLIKQGSKGEDVVRIQLRLFDLGFYTYKPTGSYQTVTKSAVMAYQSASGILNDGTIGPESMRALFARGAKRVDFHAQVPLTFTAQGEIRQKGKALTWETVKTSLTEDGAYRIRNAATGEDVTLLYTGGEGHAELTLPTAFNDRKQAEQLLVNWLGSTNSFYKCAVLLELDGEWIAASMQWDGASHVCLYVKGSVSNVLGLTDVEHSANIRKVTN